MTLIAQWTPVNVGTLSSFAGQLWARESRALTSRGPELVGRTYWYETGHYVNLLSVFFWVWAPGDPLDEDSDTACTCSSRSTWTYDLPVRSFLHFP